MDDLVPPFGRELIDVLSRIPGSNDSIESDFRNHVARGLPVVTVVGAYDAGKSSLVKRLLVDDCREVPRWLTVSARRETFEVNECVALNCILRDTPGFAAGSEEHDRSALDAIALSDAIVVAVPPQLVTSERAPIVDLVTGRFFSDHGVPFPPGSLHIVVCRMDEAGVDPVDDLDGYALCAQRKLDELRAMLTRWGVDPGAVRLHTVSADPFQQAVGTLQPDRAGFDPTRAWDGMRELEEALSGLKESLPTLRAVAARRYFALAARRALVAVEGELERQRLALESCQNDIERGSLLEQQLDATEAAARASLEALEEEEVESAARMHELSSKDLAQEAQRALSGALVRWYDRYDAALTELAREAGEEVIARQQAASDEPLAAVLADSASTQARGTERDLVQGLRRFGPHLATAVRSLHEVLLGVSLEEARKELTRVNALGGFDLYVEEMGRRRILRDTDHASSAEFAVKFHGAVAALGPLLVELGIMYSEKQRERVLSQERELRLKQLRTRIREHVQAITRGVWEEWAQRAGALRESLRERRGPAARHEPQLDEIVGRLERAHEQLKALKSGDGDLGTTGSGNSAADSSVSGGEDPDVQPSEPVHFLLVTALEEERNALLEKLENPRKLDRDGRGAHTYYEATVRTRRQDRAAYRVIVTSLSGMGPTKAAIKASAVIQRWDPRCVLMIGIGGGVSGRVEPGDVVVASEIADYTLGKVRDEQGREIRWRVHQADADLLDAATNFGAGWERLVVVPRPEAGNARRHIGTVASGGDVIDSQDRIATYKRDWPKLVAVEMEGGGMAEGLHDDIKRPRFLMIRGISDLADGPENADTKIRWRTHACHVAAAYAVAFLEDGPVNP